MGHLPQASLIKGRFGGIVNIKELRSFVFRYVQRGTRTAFSRVRVDQDELIGRNTVGIEDGVSVSAKLA